MGFTGYKTEYSLDILLDEWLLPLEKKHFAMGHHDVQQLNLGSTQISTAMFVYWELNLENNHQKRNPTYKCGNVSDLMGAKT